ncbi:T9SS type A sorting domain-containing protein, partial [candidate division WOR-3 bacterium]|nr:T9SS type A sorting domain-containing protein [candidate division WOR-3 bacterium]
DYDFVTLRYTPAGAQTWYKRYNKRPWSYDDYGTKVVFDPVTRSVVVGGTVYDDNQDYNYFTIKYRSRNGDSLWAREYNRYPANDEDMLVSVATDRYGNVYVTGTSADLTSGYDMATVKYDVNSSQRWVARYDQALDDDAGIDLVVDSLGNTLVIGYGAAFATDLDLALVKLDSTGAQKWAYVWDHPTSHNEDVGCRVAVRRDGRYIVGGTAFDNASDYDLLTMKLREVGHDFGAAFLGMPESLWVTDTLRPVAVVRNLAVSSDSCWVRLTLRPGAYRDSAWVALGVNGADTVRFRGWVPDSACVVTATAWTSLAVDERRDNDTALADVTVWDDTTGVAERRDGRPGFALAVMPNPVRQTGILRYAGIPGQRATFSLYDVSGALVWSKAEAARASGAAGERVVRLDASRLASGVYFLKLRQGEQESSRKLVVQR